MSAVFLLHFLAIPLLAAETAIRIGDTTLTVPTPEGFTPVTKEMGRVDQLLETFVAPANVRFISYIPEELMSAVQRGEIPDMPRTLSLQTNKKTVERTITTSEFKELKAIVRKQNGELMKQAEKKMPGLMEKATKQLEGQIHTKVEMNINGMLPLPSHEEGDRLMAYSILLNLTMKGVDGQVTNHPGVVTATFLHARGKLFFTYVNGGQGDLEWSRRIAREWATAILAANPSDSATAAKESARSGDSNFGQRVFGRTLIGALVGGVIGLLVHLTKRKPTTGADKTRC